MIIPFQKYHGLGNDFILVEQDVFNALSPEDQKALIPAICDRHTGIGADGFIVVRTDPFEMVYFNQDGSRADMCGNGLRCFSRYLMENGLQNDPEFIVQTLAGPKYVKASDFDSIRLSLGKADFTNEKMALSQDQNFWNSRLEEFGVDIYPLYMNTIHTVVYPLENGLEWDPVLFDDLGERISHHPLFTKGTNVNFVRVLDDHTIEMRTWERGCGMTLACGTGAAASALTSILEEKVLSPVKVKLERGDLQIELDQDQVILSGPARRIAKGEYEYENAA